MRSKLLVTLCLCLLFAGHLHAQTIASFSPVSAPPGASVTITGTGFNTTASSNIVYFGATKATVTAASTTSLTVTVPSGASHAAISVLNTSNSLAAFTTTEFIPTYTGGKGTAFAASDFNSQTTYNLGTNYQSSGVVLCDVDGDGKPDMIASNPYTNQISILLNNQSGSNVSFATKTSYNVGNSGTSPMCSPAFADLNGDGKQDIAVGDNGSGVISIFQNNSTSGSVTLGTRQTVSTLTSPYAIAFADFDKDGKPDMIVAHNGSSIASVFPNTSASGTISFGTRIDVTIGGAAYHGIGVADYDGDGKVDFAILNRGGSKVSVILNTSTSSISFAAKTDFTILANSANWLSSADIDGDGKNDLAVSYDNGTVVSVFRNSSTTSGTVTMDTRQDLTCLANSRNICFGDINGDSKVDMLVPAFSGTAAMYLNTSSSGTISFATASTVNIGAYPEGGTMGDVNNDGKPDIVQPNFGGFAIYVTRNDAAAANADLSALAISSGTLSPVFSSSTTTYTDNVTNGTSSVTVTSTKSDINSTIEVRVNGGSYATVASATASGSLALNVGSNTIDVRVTAQGGAAIKTYTITVTRAAAPGNALNFDGIDDYVAVTNNAVFNTVTYTAEAWVNLTATSGTYQCIFGRRTSAIGWNFYSDNANKWSLWNGWGEVISGPSTTFGQWVHVAVTGSASGQKMYINGTLVGSTASVVSPATTQDFVVGRVSETSAWFAKGTIDEVRFWNVERTASEIAANMNSTISPSSTGLVAYYRFDQGTAGGTNTGLTSLTDLGTNGLNGTLNTFALTGATSNWVTGYIAVNTASSDATLSALTTTAGTLTPSFAAATISYTASVSNATTSVTVTPTKNDANATIQVRINSGSYATVTSGSPSGVLALNVGNDTIDVKVTAQDGSTTKTYTIIVNRAAAIASNTITAPQSICSGSTPAALTGSTPTGGNGTYTYSWLSSTTSATAGFAAASGTANAISYSPGSLTQSTWYRRAVTSGSEKDTTAAIKVTVTNAIATNTISSTPSTICSGATPAALTASTPTGGDGSSYTYLWLSSTTSATAGFTTAAGTSNASGYTPAALTQSTWFRRVVSSGACANDTTAAVKVTVTNTIATNTISSSSSSTICSGATPAALTASTPTGGDGSSYTYLWLSSTTSATAGFTTAAGTNNASGYTPAALTQSTWLRRVVSSGACANDTTAAVKITVTNAIATNTISSTPSTICSGTTPAALTSSTPTGGDGSSYTYLWLSSTTSATAGFTTAAGTNNASGYAPATLTQSTWFRRVVLSGACANDTTVAVKITVTNTIATNTITSSPQTICSGSGPSTITASTPTGGDGTSYTYSWLRSTTSATSGFSVSSGSTTGQNYSPTGLTQNTWFRRVVSSGACANDTSAAVKITVTNAIATNTISSTPSTICSSSTPAALTASTPTGGDGSSYTYLWLSSTTSATAGFTAAAGTNNASGYTPAALTQSTWFRRVVTSGACSADTTAAVKITVTNAVATNTITSAPQTICSGTTPAALTGSTPTGGDGSSYTYLWLSSTTSATAGFTTAAGTNNASGYTPVALTQSTWLRRVVSSGACANDTTAAVKITVTNAIATNTISSTPSTICSGTTPAALTASTPTGGDGSSYTYLWLSSTTSATAGFTTAAGTNNASGYTPAALTQSTWFRRVVTSGACSADTTAAVKITVTNAVATNTITSAPQTICSGTTPAALTGSTPTGGDGSSYTYLWLSSTTSATAGFTAAAGTNNASGYSPAALTQPTWFKRVVSSGACANDTTAAQLVSISNTNTWTGTTSTAWATATNWGCGRIPVSTDSVVIVSAGNQPVITDGGRVTNSLTIAAGAVLTLNNAASALSISGILTQAGTLTHSNGLITFSGTSAQTIPANTYSNVTVNNAAGVVLAGATTVNGTLTLTSGKVTLNSNNLVLAGTTSSISGAGAGSYIRTNGTGVLSIQNIGPGGRTGAVTFHVGNSVYNPATVANTGTSDVYSVNVIDSVTNTYSGSTPTGSKVTANAVNRTWIINEAVAGGSNATVTVQWNTADELSGFSRNASYVSRYNGTTWLSTTASAATGADPYTQTRSGITSFSPFGVGSSSTLPVQLVSFTGTKKGRSVALSWTTASEISNDHFDVERSVDGKNFAFAGTVKGNGTKASASNYNLVDDVAGLMAQHAAAVYYRLTQVDHDGRKASSGIIHVSLAEATGIATSVQPNPFSSTVSVMISNVTFSEQAILDVTDLAGKVILQQHVTLTEGNNLIEVQHLDEAKDGIYFITLHTSTGVVRHKVVKANQ